MRYLIGFLITVGLIILLVVLLFTGGSKPKVTTTAKSLDSYASTDAMVRLTIDGPVNAVSLHEQVTITADKNNVTYQLLTGYSGEVKDTKTFTNTQDAYDVFLRALNHAGFTKGDTTAALKDERGYCPTGNRYVFELIQDDKSLQRFWATSCGKPKTYLGSQSLTVLLFKAQVPDYDRLSPGVSL